MPVIRRSRSASGLTSETESGNLDPFHPLGRVEDLAGEKQQADVPQDHQLHVLQPFGVGLLDRRCPEAAAVHRLASRQVDGQRDDEDDQEDSEDARRRTPRQTQEERHSRDHLEPR